MSSCLALMCASAAKNIVVSPLCLDRVALGATKEQGCVRLVRQGTVNLSQKVCCHNLFLPCGGTDMADRTTLLRVLPRQAPIKSHCRLVYAFAKGLRRC